MLFKEFPIQGVSMLLKIFFFFKKPKEGHEALKILNSNMFLKPSILTTSMLVVVFTSVRPKISTRSCADFVFTYKLGKTSLSQTQKKHKDAFKIEDFKRMLLKSKILKACLCEGQDLVLRTSMLVRSTRSCPSHKHARASIYRF